MAEMFTNKTETLTNKIDFALIFSVNNANPNGDPLDGGRPRTTSDGYGEVSDVALKRKIRNRLQDMGKEIFVQSEDRITDGFDSLKKRYDNFFKENGTAEKKSISEAACEKWIDVRAFGQVFALKKGDSKSDSKSKGVSIGIRGPVTIQSAFSKKPITIDDIQITKSVNSENSSDRMSSDRMGMKYRVSGKTIYTTFGSISPQLAEKTQFSDSDAELIKAALRTLFDNDESSARPAGSMEVLKLVWFTHNCKAGQYSSARVHRSVEVGSDGSVQVCDNDIQDLHYEILDGR